MTETNNPGLRGASPGRATEVRCRHCQDRVLVVSASREEAIKYLVAHLDREHPEVGNVMLDGKDLLIGSAPHRCDLCLTVAEPPWWTYSTPATATFSVEDPGWLVCDGCHELISSHDKPLRLLTERSLSQQKSVFILDNIPDPELRATIKLTIRRFLEHRQGDPVRGMT